jgi:hypothetical protein
MTAKERHLLELLTESPDGVTDAFLLAQGFSLDLLVHLVRVRYATAKRERSFAGGREVEITRVRVTEPGRRAVAVRRGKMP